MSGIGLDLLLFSNPVTLQNKLKKIIMKKRKNQYVVTTDKGWAMKGEGTQQIQRPKMKQKDLWLTK